MSVNESSTCSKELLSLSDGPSIHANSYAACIVNGVRFMVHSRDLRRTTQNSGVSTVGDDGSTYYGILEDILELSYKFGCKVVLFRVKWYKTNNTGRTVLSFTKHNLTHICVANEWYKDDQYILATLAKQVFYLEDQSKRQNWMVVQEVKHRTIWDRQGIQENEQDVIHDVNSSDIALDANLDSLTYTSLRGDDQSTEIIVDTDERVAIRNDDNFIDDEDDDAHSLDDSESEDLDVDNQCEINYCSSEETD